MLHQSVRWKISIECPDASKLVKIKIMFLCRNRKRCLCIFPTKECICGLLGLLRERDNDRLWSIRLYWEKMSLSNLDPCYWLLWYYYRREADESSGLKWLGFDDVVPLSWTRNAKLLMHRLPWYVWLLLTNDQSIAVIPRWLQRPILQHAVSTWCFIAIAI